MDGWIKLYRKLKDWEWYTESKMVHLFIHIVLSANHKDGKWKGNIVKRGQLITGRKQLSIETGISERSIRTCLKKMKNTQEVTIKVTNRFSIITICNYSSFQEVEKQSCQPSVTQATSKRPASDQQVTTNKNEKNEKKKVKEKKSKYGEFKNVLLTEKEYEKLTSKFNSKTNEKIQNLSEYMARVGKTYKSHYLTILKWSEKDKGTTLGGYTFE